jgi:hypothetical protein
MHTREKIMNLKIGDKVKMTPRGFRFYSNIDSIFVVHSVGGVLDNKHFTSAVCSLFAVHGVGTILKISDDNIYVKFENSLDGVGYFYTHYYDPKDIKKLSLLDKLIFKLKGIL